ncbi:MAG: trypsin-like peptidase domain-containing protein [Candidatus Aminicenantes bacterium]|nr:trypsin-like peptidase domain-containing protein [Candidatus Aminicenantes bacterium]
MTVSFGKLQNVYPKVKCAIVAIVSKVSTQPHFPPIVGTGFIAREDGLIFTCDHVVNAIEKLPRKKGASKDEWPADILIFHNVPDKGMAIIPMEIKGVIQTALFKPKGYYYGEDIPDIGVIKVNFTGLPKIELKSEISLNEGDVVAVSGFPMGEDVLIAPGWLHQFSPTLQTGIVSAILPFPCKSPHSILVDIMCKGGSSGSPIFDIESGEVLGMVYAGLNERKIIRGKNTLLVYENSSSLTLAIPCNFISTMLERIDDVPGFKEHKIEELKDFKSTISEAIEKGEYIFSPPKEPHMTEKVQIERKKN